MKWIEAENVEGNAVYIPETAIRVIEFTEKSVTIQTENNIYGHKFREEQPKDDMDNCEHRFSRWLSSENADWQVFFFTSF